MDIEKAMDNAVRYAQELIKTPSLSGREREVAYIVREYLENSGVDKVFIDELGSVVAVVKGSREDTLVFEGHIDHVPPGNIRLWRYNPYSARIVDGKLYGRGSVDMKSAVASMIASVPLISRREINTTLYLVFVVHEETAEGVALKHVFEKYIDEDKVKLVVLGEATNLNIALGHRGRCLIEVYLQGKTAHASMPEYGVNPIEALSTVVYEVVNTIKPKLPKHPKLGKATITPTVIECNPKSTPQIPDECRLILDRRVVLGESIDNILKPLVPLIEKLKAEGKILNGYTRILTERLNCWTGYVVECIDFFPPWLIDENNPLVLKLKKSLSSIKQDIRTYIWRFSTDGVYTAGTRGITTIGLGPGREELAHQPNEYVEVDSIKLAVKAYTRIFETVENTIR
ncbi:MAG TPA: YgeY family selenium metabolism-linked hydrolase [Desulfurococcales archaeon]|nr:YgeY family selenium metabolism-linked hydrolase [Desulfurococcales archaeon]